MPTPSTTAQIDLTQLKATKFIADVYMRMLLALVASAVVGYVSIQSGFLMGSMQTLGRGFGFAIFGTQLLTVIAFQASVFKMNPGIARILFAFYAVITGLTLGLVGLMYTLDSIITVAFVSGGAFAGLALYGKVTKRDLGPLGSFAISALMMLMVYSLGVWMASLIPAFQGFMGVAIQLQSVIGVVLFSALISYESQKLRRVAYQLAQQHGSDNEIEMYVNSAALNMYMNFIGLFLSLMRLMGGRRR